jgi:hypothetical protein
MAAVEDKNAATVEVKTTAPAESDASGGIKNSSGRMSRCQALGCKNVGKMQCPTCIQHKMPPSYFCSQDCFKREWKSHNNIHKGMLVSWSVDCCIQVKFRWSWFSAEFKAFVPPFFGYTGPLRPAYVTPMRTVPDDIPKPEYALTGWFISAVVQIHVTTT